MIKEKKRFIYKFLTLPLMIRIRRLSFFPKIDWYNSCFRKTSTKSSRLLQAGSVLPNISKLFEEPFSGNVLFLQNFFDIITGVFKKILIHSCDFVGSLKFGLFKHFSLMFHFYTPRKLQKTKGFLTSSGGIEMEY